MSTYQVLKYVYLNFESNWTSELYPSEVMHYTAGEEARLKVVSEGAAGLWSYDFSLKAQDSVLVIGEFIHIPTKYISKHNANTF